MARLRRNARCLVLQVLYEWDVVGHDPWKSLERSLAESGKSDAIYARRILQSVLDHVEQVDRLTQRIAPAWPVEQMAVVDRNVLRIAFCELLFAGDVPEKVAVNEAVEVAKAYAGLTSARFVNGVLGKYLSEAPSKA